ncbi:MAG: type II toxin-antitoxin system HicB family antitoxin [Bacteroidales bacterium]|nr:type II toxin-antitoxin system HicB family antitoxin [Bacteroidales bacterium]
MPDNYSAAPANEAIACIATGKTLEDVKRNIVEAIKFHIESMLEDGDPVPAEYLGQWEPDFRLSMRAIGASEGEGGGVGMGTCSDGAL